LLTGIKVNFYPAPQGSEKGFAKTPFPDGKGLVMEIKFIIPKYLFWIYPYPAKICLPGRLVTP